MSEMIERVARAIGAADPDQGGQINDSDMGDYFWEKYRDHYIPIARAAIKAMREIDEGSPAILAAGKKALYSCSSDPELEDARNAWQAMIDAALKEKA